MSAETIPGKVPAVGSVWVKKPNPVTVAASISTGVSYNFNGGSGEATLSRFLQEYEPADRSTRPAEPAAPVAEAGDGDVAASLAHLNIGYLYGIADALEHTDFTRASDIRQCLLQVVKGLSVSAATLEAERARAAQAEADLHEVEEQFAKLQEAEAQAEEEACLRVVAEASLSRVLQDRDFWKERFQVESRSRIQAEQRAADALARAEKAAEDERDRLYAEARGMDGVDSSIAAGWLRYLGPAMLPADRAILRASREAPPATDGGDNG